MVFGKISNFVIQKLYEPLVALPLTERLLCILVGVFGGLFPVPLITTGATVALSYICGLNTAATAVASAINVAMTPLQIVFIPFFADTFFHLEHFYSSYFSSDKNTCSGGGATNNNLDINGGSCTGAAFSLKPSELLFSAFKKGDLKEGLQEASHAILFAVLTWSICFLLSFMFVKMISSFICHDVGKNIDKKTKISKM